MEIMGESNIAKLTEKFDNCLKITELHNSIVGDLDEIPEATQYNDAVKWLKKTSEIISKHIITFKIDQSENIKILENSISSLRKFSDLFKGGKLTEPIFAIDEFHDLLNKSGFDITTKVEIKKIIGQTNYNLVFSKSSKEKSPIEKYQVVYDKKVSIYQNDINYINEICLENNIELNIEEVLIQINEIKNLSKKNKYKNIQNAVVCILLKKELDKYNEELESNEKNNIINNLEKLLVISRKQEPKVRKDEEQLNESDSIYIEAENLLNDSKSILDIEQNILDEIIDKNLDNYYQYALSDNPDDNEITLAIIIDSIKKSTDMLNNIIKNYQEEPELYKQASQEEILNLTEYIETYKIIKNRLNNNSEKEVNLKK